MEESRKTSSQLSLGSICAEGKTFLWDLLVSREEVSNMDTSSRFNEDERQTEQAETSGELGAKPIPALDQMQKILKEAEKQLQTLLCLPSTDKRIRLKFIESCLANLKSNRASEFSLRLLLKLFSSFQQYASKFFRPVK